MRFATGGIILPVDVRPMGLEYTTKR